MNQDPIARLLSAQPLPEATTAQWEGLCRELHREPPHRPARSRRIRWSVLAGSAFLLVLGGLWLGTSPETEASWVQVHALSQWSSPTADPTWVAMEMTSP